MEFICSPQGFQVFPKSNLNLKCYVCNSVIPGTLRPNPGCTPDGELTRSNIGLAPCNGPCFSKRDKNPNAHLRSVTYVISFLPSQLYSEVVLLG
nr:hypothetical protein BaRGS_005745 [Batillaria attramentaria]